MHACCRPGVARSLVAFALAGLGSSCQPVARDLSGLACDAGVCLDDYACHPEQGICVPAIAVGCGAPGAYCPTTTQTGDPCPSVGSFLPCADGLTDCREGCRTCRDNRTWSACTPSACAKGAGEVIGDGVDQDCDNVDLCYEDLDDDGAGSSVTVADTDLDCSNTSAATATTSGDCDDNPGACGAACRPGLAEICDGYDNDCNVSTDEAALTGPLCPKQDGVCSGSRSTTCNGAAGWAPCTDATYTAWAAASSTVYESTSGSEASCGDGRDNDCDGTADDGCLSFSSVNTGLGNTSVTSLAVDAVGDLWVGTAGNGGGYYLPYGTTTFQPVAGLLSFPIAAVITDVNGDAWFSYTQTNCDDGGTVGCDCGVTRIAGGTPTFYCTDYISTANNYVLSMASDAAGYVYLGTGDDYGIYFPPPDDTTGCDISVPDAACLVMVVDRNNPAHLWIGTSDRLRECTPNHPNTSTCSDSCTNRDDAFAGAGDNVVALAFDDAGTAGLADDRLWVGSSAKGLSRYTLPTGPATIWDSAATGQPIDDIRALAFDPLRQHVYLGTPGSGLVRYDIIADAWGVFDTNDGLLSNGIRALSIDLAHRVLWIGTDAGVASAALP